MHTAYLPRRPPHWAIADTGVRIPSAENPELSELSVYSLWSGSEYSIACFAPLPQMLPKFLFSQPTPPSTFLLLLFVCLVGWLVAVFVVCLFVYFWKT